MSKMIIGIIIGVVGTIAGGFVGTVLYVLWFVHRHGMDGQAGWGEYKPKHWWQGS